MRWQDIIKKWTPKRRSILRRVVERNDRQVWVHDTAWTNTVIWEWCDIREMIDTEQLKKLELWEEAEEIKQEAKYPLFQNVAMCMAKERRNDGSVFHGCKLG